MQPNNAKDTLVNVAKAAKGLSFAGRHLMSTSKMMLMLEAAKSSLVQIAGRDPVHSHLTRLEREKTKLINEFKESAPRFDESLSAINKTLGEVAKSQSGSYTDLTTRFGGTKREIENLTKLRQDLNNGITAFIARKDQISQDVKNRQTNGKTATDIKTMMAELEQTKRGLASRLKDLKKEEKHTFKNLDALHLDAFNALPATARGTVPLPRQQEITTPRNQ